jgi:Domain of unknown function (DUF4397)
MLAAMAATLTMAGAVSATAARAQEPAPATVVVVHGLRGLVADVYVDDTLALSTFEPERVTDAIPMVPGPHRVDIRTSGAAANSTPVLTGSVDLQAGTRYSLVAHVGAAGQSVLSAFVDDVSSVPAGQSRAIVRHTAAAPPIDVNLNEVSLAADLSNGDSAAQVLPAATYQVTVRATGEADAIAPPQDVPLEEGTATSMYLIGAADDRSLGWVAVKASGLQTPPAGVQTGDGSLFEADAESSWWRSPSVAVVGAAGVAIAVAVAGFTVRRRRAA